MSQLHALGQAGGAGGIDQQRGIARLDRQQRILAFTAGDPEFEFAVIRAARIEHHRPEVAGAVLPGAAQQGLEFTVDEHQCALSIIDDLPQLRRGEPPVERHDRRGSLVHTEQQLEVARGVLAEEADMLARLHSAGNQGAGDPAGALVELRPAQLAQTVDQCGPVRRDTPVVAGNVRQAVDVVVQPHGAGLPV